jgi:3',5'-cyclic AMP phosphodiesterase CpdA
MTTHCAKNDGAKAEQAALTRRSLLECAPWAGTGIVWGLSGGVPYALGLVGEASAAEATGLTFLQISDSHIGFAKPVNPDVKGTLGEAVSRIAAMPTKPSFLIHTGDITHLSKAREFDDAEQIISQAGLTTHYVPGEHDLLDPEMSLFRERHGQGTKGAGWYSFDAAGVHFIGLVNVDMSGRDMGVVYIDDPGPKAGGLGVLGEDQIAWVADDLHGRSSSTPIVVFAHVPLWAAYPTWGWGTQDSARVLALLKRFGSVTVLNGHIHQVLQKVEGDIVFHTAMSTAFPQPAPGSAPKPGPKKVAADRLRTVLGSTTVTFRQGQKRLALIDAPLKG